jgi:hypothetical protein
MINYRQLLETGDQEILKLLDIYEILQSLHNFHHHDKLLNFLD